MRNAATSPKSEIQAGRGTSACGHACLVLLLAACGEPAGTRVAEDPSRSPASAGSQPAPDDAPSPADAPALPYAQAGFWRPDGAGSAGLDPYLAPLFYLAVEGDDAHPPALAPAAKPTVWYEDTTVTLGGRPHRQLSFFWRTERGTALQGVRTTFASSGAPWVHELLLDATEHEQVFVASALERAARAAHGEPLAGRAHAIEAAPADGVPRADVAGVLADGPVAMGPYIYVRPTTNRVEALHCRCEQTRAEAIVDERTYRLAPLEALLQQLDATERAQLDFGPPDALASQLRLPAEF